MSRHILDTGFLHVDDIPSEVDLVAELQSLHAQGVEVPCIWTISAGPDDPTSDEVMALGFGINGSVGVLDWADAEGRFVPRDGSNTEWTTYRLAGMHDAPVPPNAEVAPEKVFAALAEFLRTRSRPTCVEWAKSADITSLCTADNSDAPYNA